MDTVIDKVLDDVARYQATKMRDPALTAWYPENRRKWRDRAIPLGFRGETPIFITDTETQHYAPTEFSDLQVTGRQAYDVFVRRPGVTDWEYKSTHKSATAAWTAQNIVRRNHATLQVKMLPKSLSAFSEWIT